MSYAEVMQAGLGPPRGELIGVGEERGGGYRPEHPLGGRPEFWEFMCTAVEVEVDPETGMVDVTRLVLASDVGKALNPLQVETQDEGAATMGVGHSLMEELILDSSGRIVNLGAMDYRIPTIQDIPRRAPLGAHRERGRSRSVRCEGRRAKGASSALPARLAPRSIRPSA